MPEPLDQPNLAGWDKAAAFIAKYLAEDPLAKSGLIGADDALRPMLQKTFPALVGTARQRQADHGTGS